MEGKVIAVLGASSGIGEGIARVAAEMHPKGLILGARRTELLNKLAQEYKSTDTLVIQTDVTSMSDLKNFIDRSVQKYGRIDAVINSAGMIQEDTPIDKHEPEKISSIINTNLTQALQLAHYLIPQFRKQGQGVYVVVSSQAAKYSFAGEAAYCASKAGLNHGIRCIDQELIPLRTDGNKIYAFSIGPGFINTEEAKKKFPDAIKTIEEAPTPREFAQHVLSYITDPRKNYDTFGSVRILETKRV